MKQSPSSGGMRQSPFSGGMTTRDPATTIEIRDNACETRESPSFGGIPIAWWDWPDEALLADFAEKDNGVEQAEQPPEDDPEYATLYFVA